MITKSEIRSTHLAIRNNMSDEEKLTEDKKIQEKLYNSLFYQKCNNLFSFVSFKSEIDTHDIIKQSLASGKKVYIPRVEKHGMEFYHIYNLDGLIPSKFGVPEPTQDPDNLFSQDTVSDNMAAYNNIMIVPGLAFDYQGNRIGYGAGYYDKYLHVHKNVNFYKVALAYDFQLIDKINAEAHDIGVDMIITPSRIINTK